MIGICIKCKKKKEYEAFNLCHNCYMSYWRKKRARLGLVPEKERQKQKVNFRKWYLRNKEKHIANCKEYTKKHRVKHNIRLKTRTHIKTKCNECNNTTDLEIHHSSYKEPYNIKVLCRDCHRKGHRLCNK